VKLQKQTHTQLPDGHSAYIAEVADGCLRIYVSNDPVNGPGVPPILHASVSFKGNGTDKFVRLPTDEEMQSVASQVFGTTPCEENNSAGNGTVRHIWEIDAWPEGPEVMY
jgi:hypothetical protein